MRKICLRCVGGLDSREIKMKQRQSIHTTQKKKKNF